MQPNPNPVDCGNTRAGRLVAQVAFHWNYVGRPELALGQ